MYMYIYIYIYTYLPSGPRRLLEEDCQQTLASLGPHPHAKHVPTQVRHIL